MALEGFRSLETAASRMLFTQADERTVRVCVCVCIREIERQTGRGRSRLHTGSLTGSQDSRVPPWVEGGAKTLNHRG